MKSIFFLAASCALFFTLPLYSQEDPKNNKESYVRKAEREVQIWTEKLNKLQEKSQQKGTETRQELDEKVRLAEEKLAVARQKLEEVRGSSEEVWKNLRQDLDAALQDVKRAWKNAQMIFNKGETKEAEHEK